MNAPVKRYFYDTEFLEDGKTIDLLSFAMVTQEGDEFYRVNTDANWYNAFQNDWIRGNVMGSIKHEVHVPYDPDKRTTVTITEPWPTVAPKLKIARDLVGFVENSLPPNHVPEFWAYYGDYDHVAMAQLFGPMLHLPAFFPMFTMDIKQLAVMKGNPTLPTQVDGGEHNALSDARYNVVMFEYLTSNDFSIMEEWL